MAFPECLRGTYHTVEGCPYDPLELTAAITALANGIACELSADELNLLGVVLTQLGDTLATIAAQRSFCENK